MKKSNAFYLQCDRKMASRGESNRGSQSGSRSTSSGGSRSTSSGGSRSASSRGRSPPSIRQSSVSSASVANTSPELGIPSCMHMNVQSTATGSPSALPVEHTSAPPVIQPPPASDDAAEGQSSESDSTGHWDPLEYFDKAPADEESSVNQNEMQNGIATRRRDKPSQSNREFHDILRELEEKVARMEAEIRAAQAERKAFMAERKAFMVAVIAALRSKGIDVSGFPFDDPTPPLPQAPKGESDSPVNEHSPTPKRPRTAITANYFADDPDNDEENL